MLVGSDPWAPEGVAPQKSEAKLFQKLQQLPCYTWASSPFLQLTEKTFLLCLFIEESLRLIKKFKIKNQNYNPSLCFGKALIISGLIRCILTARERVSIIL